MNTSYENWKRARRNRVVLIVVGVLLGLALAAMFIIGLQGATPLEGAWYLTSVNGESIDSQQYFQIVFERGGGGTLTHRVRSENPDDQMVTPFTWQADGSRLNLGSDLHFLGFSLLQGEPAIWNITGNSLAISTEFMTLNFQR